MIGLLLAAEESLLVRNEIAAIILLAIAAGVSLIAKRLNFPYTVALVIAGFGASVLGELVTVVEVSPDLILFLLVPPLLFEATLHLPWNKLRADLVPVLLLALVGTTVGTVGLGALVHYSLDIPWTAAFAFGALISATDPVAVISFFKSLGTPKRLSVLVEGESLFNDAVAVVAFGLAVDAAKGEGFSLGDAFVDFVVVSAGGLAVGLVLGYVVGEILLSRIDDPLIETSTTLALAYGSFLAAEEAGVMVGRDFHFSGILAVVAAGLMVGTVGLRNTSPSTRLTLEHFWELLTFLVNSLVFLFIGLTITFRDLAGELDAVVIALVGVIVVRVALVYGLAELTERIVPSRYIPMSYRHVMTWGGLRGAISLALVLTMTNDVFDDGTLKTVKVMTFGVVLFTLIIQGTSITGLINRLGLAGRADNELEQQRHQARIAMRRAGQAEINRLGAEGVLFADMADALGRTYQQDVSRQSASLRDHFRAHPELEIAMLLQARRDALYAERSALSEVVRTGLVEDQVGSDLAVELNNRLAAIDLLEERWESDPLPVTASDGDES